MDDMEDGADIHHSRQKDKITSVSEISDGRGDVRDDLPRMGLEELLKLFGGKEENVEYYLSLKEAIVQSRRSGDICWCDPRDVNMRKRLDTLQWKPKIILKPVDVPESSDSDAYGFSTKQTALDDCGDRDVKDSIQGENNVKGAAGEGSGEEGGKSFFCGVNGCNQNFTSLASFVCASCKRKFVSNFLLDIHLQENHDSYFEILRSRLDMYRCLVESCNQKFRTAELRKEHLIKQHKFTGSFSFHRPIKPKTQTSKAPDDSFSTSGEENSMEGISNEESSSSSSFLSHPPSPSSKPTSMDTGAVDGSSTTQSFQARGKRGKGNANSRGRGKKVPPVICFGRGSQRAFQRRGRGGRGRHWHQTGSMDVDTTVDIEKVNFGDLVESLQE